MTLMRATGQEDLSRTAIYFASAVRKHFSSNAAALSVVIVVAAAAGCQPQEPRPYS